TQRISESAKVAVVTAGSAGTGSRGAGGGVRARAAEACNRAARPTRALRNGVERCLVRGRGGGGKGVVVSRGRLRSNVPRGRGPRPWIALPEMQAAQQAKSSCPRAEDRAGAGPVGGPDGFGCGREGKWRRGWDSNPREAFDLYSL